MAAEVREPRVYTDDRLPSLKVVNQGDIRFIVYEDGMEIDSFTAYERPGVPVTSEPFAQRRAKAYFDHMAGGQMSAELAVREEPTEPQEVPVKSAGDPLTGMREMTRQDIDAVIAAARAETDPQKAAALKKQALSMMAQQESAAQKVVRFLLSL